MESHPGQPGLMPVKQYRKGGGSLEAHFHEGKCDGITFTKLDRDERSISKSEQELLLAANGGGKEWEDAGTAGTRIAFRTTDGVLLAHHDLSDHSFTICTREAVRRDNEATKAAEAAKLKGF